MFEPVELRLEGVEEGGHGRVVQRDPVLNQLIHRYLHLGELVHQLGNLDKFEIAVSCTAAYFGPRL